MGDRDFNIPMGPDRTGAIDLEPIDFGDGSTAGSETLESYFSDQDPAQTQAFGNVEQASAYQPERFADTQVIEEDVAPIVDEEQDAPEAPEGGSNQVVDDVQTSFVALGDSIKQGRELKSREKEREALNEQILVDREELADRENILANYRYLVAEQDDIIARSTAERDALKDELASTTAQMEEANDALARMKDYHSAQIQPIENALARAQVAADQAKNDERSRKSELSAAESELRKAEGDNATAVASAKVQQIEAAKNEAHARYEAAKNELDRAQDAYDDMAAEFDQAEAPLERTIEDCEKHIDELKDTIAQLGDTIATARKRRQYCDEVYQRPNETADLRADVESDEAAMRQMDEENEALRAQLKESKAKAKTAKIAIAAIIAIIIIIIVAFVVAGMRAG